MHNSLLPLQPNQAQRNSGDAYLKIGLNSQILAVLPMQYAQEVVTVPTQSITAIPLMPACILGLLNRHNKVLWVVDLIQMLGLKPVNLNTQQYNIAIIRVGEKALGLLVQEFKGVIRLTPDSIQPPLENIGSNLSAYLQGCILQQTQILMVLNPEAIVNSPILQSK